MRNLLGIIAPFLVQIGIILLYSAIRYERLDSALLTTVFILIFPILIIYVLAPHFITFIGNVKSRISDRLDKELDKLIISEHEYSDESKTLLLKMNFKSTEELDKISESIKSKLVPLLSHRALSYYKDTYYSRSNEIKPEKSLVYFEALVMFSGLSLIFFALDLIIIWLMSTMTITFYFIELDQILSLRITINLTIIFLSGIGLSYYILQYAFSRFEYYLPYVVPILFVEPEDEQYLRRETIRSLVDYNLDNLIDRRDQRKYNDQIDSAQNELLTPLLRDEILITARTEFAKKLAWREYSALLGTSIFKETNGDQSLLKKLVIGNKIGPVQLDEKDLLGINSDLEYINLQLKKWNKVSHETQVFVYFQLYRAVEYILREISNSINLLPEDEEFNLYTAINAFYDLAYIDEDDKTTLHNMRYRRNKLMHEPGISLNVSKDRIEETINTVNKILEILIQEPEVIRSK